jgi:putative Mg2+ transporter-C (MgtC) family protein
VLAGNTLLRPLVDAINRAPFDERTSEATYEIHVMTEAEHVGEVRDCVIEVLEAASYPIRDVEVVERSDEITEVVATLVSTAVEPAELDAAAEKIATSPRVSHASWSSNAEA